ncbi:MAG: hypothetical protein WD063_01515 [Pirellulales bacterium]
MSIDFRCTNCEKLLRTQPGTAGKKARCPQCGTVLVIPDSAAEAAPPEHPFDAPPPREPDFAASPQSANPYQAPSAYAAHTPLPRGFKPTRIDFSETLSKTWRIYTSNLGACIAGSLVTNLCGNVATVIVGGFGAALIGNGRALVVPVVLLEIAALGLINSFFLVGLMKFMLTIARGETVNFADLFGGGQLALPGAVVLAMLAVGTIAGGLFCLVPGVIFLLFFSQALYMLVDQRTSVIDSFRYSASAMQGNALVFFLLFVVLSIAAALFTVLTCFIGALFAAPFVSVLFAVVYLGVTGQGTAVDGAATHVAERTFDASGMQAT